MGLLLNITLHTELLRGDQASKYQLRHTDIFVWWACNGIAQTAHAANPWHKILNSGGVARGNTKNLMSYVNHNFRLKMT